MYISLEDQGGAYDEEIFFFCLLNHQRMEPQSELADRMAELFDAIK